VSKPDKPETGNPLPPPANVPSPNRETSTSSLGPPARPLQLNVALKESHPLFVMVIEAVGLAVTGAGQANRNVTQTNRAATRFMLLTSKGALYTPSPRIRNMPSNRPVSWVLHV